MRYRDLELGDTLVGETPPISTYTLVKKEASSRGAGWTRIVMFNHDSGCLFTDEAFGNNPVHFFTVYKKAGG